jgi:type II secretory pathway component PulF
MPQLAVRMVGVGEKAGRLQETSAYLGEYFEGEVDAAAKNFATILEPVILIVIGLLVAFIALSILGPIYHFTGSVK